MSKKFWIGSIATLGVIDYYAAFYRKNGTLSQCGRELFHTDTTAGKVAWAAGWGTLSVWIVPHIWKWPIDKMSS